jgi:hypothetical protein
VEGRSIDPKTRREHLASGTRRALTKIFDMVTGKLSTATKAQSTFTESGAIGPGTERVRALLGFATARRQPLHQKGG